MIPERLYSCDDHLDLWNLPREVWEDRLPERWRARGPRVVDQGGVKCYQLRAAVWIRLIWNHR
jgi:hypothetical protein